MVNFKWTVHEVEWQKEQGALNNVIDTIHWRYSITDENGNTESIISVEHLTHNPEDPFVPYEDVTPAMVIGWLEASLGVERISELQTQLTTMLEAKVNPPRGRGFYMTEIITPGV